jgi:hypothetical protein
MTPASNAAIATVDISCASPRNAARRRAESVASKHKSRPPRRKTRMTARVIRFRN